MKYFTILLLFFLIGFILVAAYTYWNYQKRNFPSPNTRITTKFSLENAPSNSLRGTIASMSGTVSWLSRTAAKPVPLHVPRAIQQGEEVSTGSNGHALVRIQNNALLTIFAKSHINFIQLVPINFVFIQDKESIFYQSNGQSLEVISHGLNTSIARGWATITVDPVENIITITVKQGTVTEGYQDQDELHTSNVILVSVGQQFVFDTTTQTGSIQSIKQM